MNSENLKQKVYNMEQECKRLVIEIANSSDTYTDKDVDEIQSNINALRSHIEYLTSTIRRKKEKILHG